VMYGARNPQSEKTRKALAVSGEKAQIGSVSDAVAFGDVVVLAVRYDAIADVIANGGDWNGKIIIDAMNYFGPAKESSVAQEVAQLASGAKVVKAFNTLGAEQFAKPDFGGVTVSMFICGDDAAAKSVVADLTEELGFEVVDCGTLENAILVEGLARLWVSLARSGTGRDIAFKLLRR
jgi:8-hydroxy-5-deazaflavin:NADPH oxidoreductase